MTQGTQKISRHGELVRPGAPLVPEACDDHLLEQVVCHVPLTSFFLQNQQTNRSQWRNKSDSVEESQSQNVREM